MPNQPPSARGPAAPEPRDYSPLAAVLSYLVPGLGHIVQGRVTKGVFFLVSLSALFFGGMYLGSWKNVYIPRTDPNNGLGRGLPGWVNDVYNRPQFLGQFWIGPAAWPAILQYNKVPLPFKDVSPAWAEFEQAPPESELIALQAAGDKTWDLGWVYTVIAGVLNILVIYDAFAGPVFAAPAEAARPRPEGTPA